MLINVPILNLTQQQPIVVVSSDWQRYLFVFADRTWGTR